MKETLFFIGLLCLIVAWPTYGSIQNGERLLKGPNTHDRREYVQTHGPDLTDDYRLFAGILIGGIACLGGSLVWMAAGARKPDPIPAPIPAVPVPSAADLEEARLRAEQEAKRRADDEKRLALVRQADAEAERKRQAEIAAEAQRQKELREIAELAQAFSGGGGTGGGMTIKTTIGGKEVVISQNFDAEKAAKIETERKKQEKMEIEIGTELTKREMLEVELEAARRKQAALERALENMDKEW